MPKLVLPSSRKTFHLLDLPKMTRKSAGTEIDKTSEDEMRRRSATKRDSEQERRGERSRRRESEDRQRSSSGKKRKSWLFVKHESILRLNVVRNSRQPPESSPTCVADGHAWERPKRFGWMSKLFFIGNHT